MTIASIAPPKVNQELITALEHLLERARSGELLAVAICGELTGRQVSTLVSGECDVFRMLGGLEVVKRKVLARVEVSESERHG